MKAEEIAIELEDGKVIDGTFMVPLGARGVVIFAHGSGSSRFSKRNGYVAGVLQTGGFATLLLDLLTSDEERIDNVTRELRFDIPLLAGRVVSAIEWAKTERDVQHLPIGLFGASTGAAAALIAAAARPEIVSAVVSRGGRPDLAETALPLVTAPTLLIVGGEDIEVLDLNQAAARRLTACHAELTVVEGATHLFEEKGKLVEVATLAREWFARFLGAPAEAGAPSRP